MQDPIHSHEHRDSREDDVIWNDPVTGTPFAIPQKQYQELLTSAENQLRRCSADDAYNLLTALPYPFGETIGMEELALHIPFPMIPYDATSDSTRVRVRLVDFLLLRTGLYFAIFAPTADEWTLLRTE